VTPSFETSMVGRRQQAAWSDEYLLQVLKN
jgi:hypothetical protein